MVAKLDTPVTDPELVGSSMYESIFHDGHEGMPLLRILGFQKRADIGRYRAAWVEYVPSEVLQGSPYADKLANFPYRVVVYTRNGGLGRETYMPKDIAKRFYYLGDKDDAFDSTYCSIYFMCPEDLREAIGRAIAGGSKIRECVNTDVRWEQAVANLSTQDRQSFATTDGSNEGE